MPVFLLKLLADPRALVGIGFALLLAFAAIQSERLKHAKADLTAARAALVAANVATASSEKLRATEYATAKSAVSDAETACSARVAAAQRSGAAIHRLVERPARVDPKTSCPVRALISAGELRDALQPTG